jgi:hypothetical protein
MIVRPITCGMCGADFLGGIDLAGLVDRPEPHLAGRIAVVLG